jgi:hypothetical protein
MSDAAQRTLLAVGGVPAIASYVGETVAEAPDPDESLSCQELPPHPEVTTTSNSQVTRQRGSPSSLIPGVAASSGSHNDEQLPSDSATKIAE